MKDDAGERQGPDHGGALNQGTQDDQPRGRKTYQTF